MPSNRQQRTNYTRQKPKPGAPPIRNNIGWSLTSVSGTEIVLTIDGSTSGLVKNGTPTFEILATAIVTVASVLTGDTLTLEMSDPVPQPGVLVLRTPSIAIRNEFGGLLNSGFAEIPAIPPPPEASTMSILSFSGPELTMQLAGGGPGFYANQNLQLHNDTASEYSSECLISGDVCVFRFTNPLSSGDAISWTPPADSFRNDSGGTMTAGTENIP